jgi:hypothetical protein
MLSIRAGAEEDGVSSRPLLRSPIFAKAEAAHERPDNRRSRIYSAALKVRGEILRASGSRRRRRSRENLDRHACAHAAGIDEFAVAPPNAKPCGGSAG